MRTIKAHPAKKNGRIWHRVIEPASETNPKPKQHWYRSKERADAFARTVNASRGSKLREVPLLNDSDQLLMAQALTKAGSAQKVFDAVMMYADKIVAERKPVAQVVKECVRAKAEAGCRPAYITPFELMLDRFALHCGAKTLDKVTVADVEAFINAPKVRVSGKNRVPDGPPSQWTRRARWIDLRTFFSFSLSRGYARENLAEKLEPIQIDHKAPEILRPSTVKDLLSKVHSKTPHLIPYVALCLFGGLRPQEAQRVTWSDVQADFVVMSSAATKTRRRRLVTLNPTLRAWLALGGDLPVTEPRARKVRDLIERWPKNGLRHSFVSYHYALHGGKETAREAGHSEDILHAHYRELVTKKAAEDFWGLTPTVVLGNVIALPAAKAA